MKNNAVYIIIVFYCIYMELSIEQNYAINLFENGENIALMGPAGTGK